MRCTLKFTHPRLTDEMLSNEQGKSKHLLGLILTQVLVDLNDKFYT